MQIVVMDPFGTILCCRAFFVNVVEWSFYNTPMEIITNTWGSDLGNLLLMDDGRDRFFQIVVGKLFGEYRGSCL